MTLAATNMMVVANHDKVNHEISNDLKFSDALAVTWPEQFWDVLFGVTQRLLPGEKKIVKHCFSSIAEHRREMWAVPAVLRNTYPEKTLLTLSDAECRKKKASES